MPRLDDWNDPELQRVAAEWLGIPPDLWLMIERKYWEWAFMLRALDVHGYVRPDKVALGLGSGHETPLYYLSTRLRMTVATDVYEGAFSTNEADPDMLRDPSRFATIPFDPSGLLVASMDATNLGFADRSFDIVFSCSSVEHFGSTANIVRSMQEAYRVLRPGGVYALSVDHIFRTPGRLKKRGKRGGPLDEFLTADEVMEYLVESPGFSLRQPVDFRMEEGSIVNICDMTKWLPAPGTASFNPHIVLEWEGTLLTSLFLLLFKED
jgi:SAM-dependent methyltransferase